MYARMRQAGIVSGLIILIGIISAVSNAAMAQPTPPQWEGVMGALMSVHEQPEITRKSWHTPGCEAQMVIVEDYATRAEREVCIISSGSVQLGVYVQSPGGSALYALKRSSDEVFHRITNLTVNPSRLVLLPDDTILGASQIPSDILAMYSLSNVHERLVEVPIATGPSTYNKVYDMDMQAIVKFVDSNNQTFSVSAIAVSNSKKFAVAQSLGRGIVRVNLETREVRRISDDTTGQLNTVLAVSNDGKRVAVTGDKFAPHRIYTGLDSCGSTEVNTAFDDEQRCYAVSFAAAIEPELEAAAVYEAEFSAGGNLVAYTWNEHTQHVRMLEFTPDPTSYRLDYLALGDSYSSGEGDIGRRSDGSNYYLPGTDSDGGCHISSRSYPFLLRAKWGISTDRMQSVACSGAQVVFDYYRSPEGYLGQNNRLARNGDMAFTQALALQNFTPGHIPQLEFVKKYQPRLVTFTGGGNDIGFESILRLCASPHWQDLTPIINLFSDCGYVHEGSELQRLLYSAIDSQYGYNKRFIEEIKRVSPQTKIVTIGYPSFVADYSNTGCVPNSGLLSRTEIQMTNKAVDYTNSMLQRLAHDTGTHFVDITNSLNGGRICEGSEYMTGAWPRISETAVDEERFHPNAAGHQQIAETIHQASIYSADAIPGPGLYDSAKEFIHTIMVHLVHLGTVSIDGKVHLRAGAGTLGSNDQYSVTVHSTPTYLGTFTADSDGGINQEVSFEGVPPGLHTLIVKGVDEHSEPKHLYQFITVQEPDSIADGYSRSSANDQTGINAPARQPAMVVGAVSDANNHLTDDSESNMTEITNEEKRAVDISPETTESTESRQEDAGIDLWILIFGMLAGASIVVIEGAWYVRRKANRSKDKG